MLLGKVLGLVMNATNDGVSAKIFMDLFFKVAVLTAKSVKITYRKNKFCAYGINFMGNNC